MFIEEGIRLLPPSGCTSHTHDVIPGVAGIKIHVPRMLFFQLKVLLLEMFVNFDDFFRRQGGQALACVPGLSLK